MQVNSEIGKDGIFSMIKIVQTYKYHLFAIREIKPKTILLYGTPIADYDFGDIEVVHYKNEVLERRAGHGR